MEDIIKLISTSIIGTEFENKTYIAGGYVRDTVMGNISKDLDITVELPDGGIKLSMFLYEKLNTSEPVIYQRFGTAMVVYEGIDIEFTNTRKESYDGISRNPLTSFGSIYEDVIRRDFTINSLLINISTGQVLDLTGRGMKDIKRKIIRATSDPNIIFNEDPLRIMRAIRFASKLGFNIDTNTFNYIKKYTSQLKRISVERIRDEFNKILLSDNFVKGVELLLDTGIMWFICKDMYSLVGLEQPQKYHVKDAWGHTMDVLRVSKNTIEHRLSALFHDIGKVKTASNVDNEIHFYGHDKESVKITKKCLNNLKYPLNTIELVTKAIDLHMVWNENISKKYIRRSLNELGHETLMFCIDLAVADSFSHRGQNRLNNITNTISFIFDEMNKPKIVFPIDGRDIMNRYNIPSGKKIGILVEAMKDLFYENPKITIDEIYESLDVLNVDIS